MRVVVLEQSLQLGQRFRREFWKSPIKIGKRADFGLVGMSHLIFREDAGYVEEKGETLATPATFAVNAIVVPILDLTGALLLDIIPAAALASLATDVRILRRDILNRHPFFRRRNIALVAQRPGR